MTLSFGPSTQSKWVVPGHGRQVNLIVVAPIYRFALRNGITLIPGTYNLQLEKWEFGYPFNVSALVSSKVTKFELIGQDMMTSPWNLMATFCLQTDFHWAVPQISDCMGVNQPDLENVTNRLFTNQTGEEHFKYTPTLQVAHMTGSPSRKCEAHELFELSSITMDFQCDISNYPCILPQGNLTSGVVYDSSNQKLKVDMFYNNGTIYRNLLFASGFGFEVQNNANELSLVRTNETFTLLVMHHDCVLYTEDSNWIGASDLLLSRPEALNPLGAKAITLRLNITDCKAENFDSHG